MNPSAALVLLPLALPTGPARMDPARQDAAPVTPLGPGMAIELTLDTAIEWALNRNLGIKIEELATEVTWYDSRGSWGSFDWRFSAGASAQDREFESTSVFGGSSESTLAGNLELLRPLETGGTFTARFDRQNQKTDSTFAAQETATTDVVALAYVQPLLRGAWREYATVLQRGADLTWKRQSERERQVRHELIFNVSNAYWDLVLARARLEVAQSSLGLAGAQLDQDQRRLDAGIGIQLDVFSAETEVARNEELVLQAELEVRQSADVLKELLFPGTEAALWDTMLVPSTPLAAEASAAGAPEWTAALTTAIERRAELRQQRITIEQTTLQHQSRANEREAALDLELSASGTGFDGDSAQALESALSYEFPTWRAALSYSIPLTNRTAKFAEKSAWAAVRSQRLVYDQLETRIAGEVREAVRQVRYQAEAVRASRKSLDLAQRLLSAEQAKRQEGVSTNFEVLRLQRDLANAMNNERTARVNFAKAEVALKSAQGLLAEAPVR